VADGVEVVVVEGVEGETVIETDVSGIPHGHSEDADLCTELE
jgi:hypothetical protein